MTKARSSACRQWLRHVGRLSGECRRLTSTVTGCCELGRGPATGSWQQLILLLNAGQGACIKQGSAVGQWFTT
jgi:hypothetical protein